MDSFLRGKKKKGKQKHKKRSSKAKKASSGSDSSSSNGSSDEWAEAPPKARSTEELERSADHTSKAVQIYIDHRSVMNDQGEHFSSSTTERLMDELRRCHPNNIGKGSQSAEKRRENRRARAERKDFEDCL